MGKKRRLSFALTGLVTWLIIAQFILKRRESDRCAKRKFSKKGITLLTKTINARGIKLHYVQVGDDSLPTLFFIHGSPQSWNCFTEYLQDPGLGKQFRMIAVDRPGFGYTEFGNARDLDEQAVIVSYLLQKKFNSKPFYLIGHSYGGALAVKLHLMNPGNITGLILLAASIDPAAEKGASWRGIFSKTPFQYLLPGAFRPSNEEMYYLKDDLDRLRRRLYKVTTPVWALHGTEDKIVPLRTVDFAKKEMKNTSVRIKILPGAGHFFLWDDEFEEVKTFLLGLEKEAVPDVN